MMFFRATLSFLLSMAVVVRSAGPGRRSGCGAEGAVADVASPRLARRQLGWDSRQGRCVDAPAAGGACARDAQ